jgi:hypothetical protein
VDLQLKFALRGDLHGLAQDVHLRIARGARTAAEKQSARSKVALRGDVRAAGLGDRFANVWRISIYPESASKRTHEPAVVAAVPDKAKTTREDSFGNTSTIASAADIVRAHTEGPIIQSRNGLYLALPTSNTPRKGRRFMTPVEVEAQFNQDLIFFAGKGRQMLAFVDVVAAKSGRGFRKATRRRTRDGREKHLVLMFVMVRQVTLRKKLNWPAIFRDLERGWAELFPAEVADSLNK